MCNPSNLNNNEEQSAAQENRGFDMENINVRTNSVILHANKLIIESSKDSHAPPPYNLEIANSSASVVPNQASPAVANAASAEKTDDVPEESSSAKEVTCFNRVTKQGTGIILASLSMVLMTIYTILLKLILMDTFQVAAVRGAVQTLGMGIIMLYQGKSIIPKSSTKMITSFLIITIVTGGIRVLLIFKGFQMLPTGDATAILYSSPIFTMILSKWILQTPCGVRNCIICVILAGGILLISRPPLIFGSEDEYEYIPAGYLVVSGASFLSALSLVINKKIISVHSKELVTLYVGLSTLIVSIICLFTMGQPAITPVTDWLLAVGIGLLGASQQYLTIIAVGHTLPYTVASIKQLQIVLTYGLQVALFGMIPHVTKIIGATMIVVTTLFSSFAPQNLSERLITWWTRKSNKDRPANAMEGDQPSEVNQANKDNNNNI